MTDLDDVVRRLSEVQDQLLALPDDAFAEKYRLQQRRKELRDLAEEFTDDWDAERPTENLLRELKSLRQRLAEVNKQRINLVSQAGSGGPEGAGASGLGGVSLNTAISDAQGMGTIQARIGRINSILTDRGVEVPD